APRGLRNRDDGCAGGMRKLRREWAGRRVRGLRPRTGHGRPLPQLPERADGARHHPWAYVCRSARARQTRAFRMSRRQRLTLPAAILGSAVAMIDGSIVNVALPALERDLGVE